MLWKVTQFPTLKYVVKIQLITFIILEAKSIVKQTDLNLKQDRKNCDHGDIMQHIYGLILNFVCLSLCFSSCHVRMVDYLRHTAA